MSLRGAIERLFPLLPPERRRGNPTLLKWMGPQLRLERDADYLTYIFYPLMLSVNFLFLLLLVADSYAATGLLVEPGLFARDTLLIPTIFTNFTKWPTLVVTLIFYLRIRVAIDLQHEMPPRAFNKWALRSNSRWRWIINAIIFLAIGVWALFNSHRIVLGVLHRIDWGKGLFLVISAQCLWIVLLSQLPNSFIRLALFLEKSLRFFPNAQEDLLRPDYE